ncbi:hypothetical protein [Nostoc sp. FACHB-888]|uniref:hypothetical protein n=1 Tax=Nostoc sp. FACHB-888 TaxID=2692842 RepID=UPI0016892EA2|nr:hypothetical protein [Nostoc sp. FACHB-888]MBD2247475.1 hypothetical protein [Nostoc sp. FACHB-888]
MHLNILLESNNLDTVTFSLFFSKPYVRCTNLQTAHNVYLDGKFLGIVFKVRNADEVWENDPKTYYWQCTDGVRYWSVKEAVEGLSRATAPIELPQVRRELVAA